MTIKSAIRRGAGRLLFLFAVGIALLWAADIWPRALGPTGAPLAFGIGLCLVGLAVGDMVLRILQPKIDTQAAAQAGMGGSTAAALVYLGRCILAGVILMLFVTSSRAAEPPAAAVALLPVLKAEQVQLWPDLRMASVLGAQVEQETCTSLKSRGCWNPRAELRTSREQGIGLGQLTRAFRSDGSTRFDALAEIRRDYPRELTGLSWEAPYDAGLQLRALVLKDRQGFLKVQGSATHEDQLAMAFSAYNGGLGGLASDRKACAGTPGCEPGRWFGHVERTSLKAKAAVPGYGQSFFQINRSYVTNVMNVRRVRYLSLDS